MKLFATIRDSDIGNSAKAPAAYQERRASRAIVFDADKNVALLHASKKQYHKLPGGGIEAGEKIEDALRREVLEEIGCGIRNIRELGEIEEYRDEFALHQISYCFIADVLGGKGAPQLTDEETEDGFETTWIGLDAAVTLLVSEANVQNYEGKFIRLRDLIFLKEAAKEIKILV